MSYFSLLKYLCSILISGQIIRDNVQYKQKYKYQMSEQWVPKKPNFGPPPPGYIAGLGRGATGFVTRSDLGPAARAANIAHIKKPEDDQAAYADNKYDSWEGFKGALFTKDQVDEEDRQADDAFDFCQKRMEERRLKQKQAKMKQQLEKQKKLKKNINNAPISQQFTDLKRQLAKVTEQQWMNLPQAVDLSIKKRKRQKYTPVPDTMIVNYLNSNVNRTEIEQSIGQSNQNYRQAKQMLLKSNLQKAQNEAGGKSGVDRIGYLTSLDITKVDEELFSDIKRARLLHKAALTSNPKNPDIWLSAARIEELDGKIQQCRNILHKALQNCPTNEDIWIQLSRVQKADESKNILIEALRNLPKSQKIWLKIARKQNQNKEMKSKILRKGLQNIPQSTKLWKQLIQLSNTQQAKNLLYKAVQCLPKQIDLWIGLAKLQTYENAKQVLNKARKANPLSLAIWINAAKLQESQSQSHEKSISKIQTIITKACQILKKNGNTISREQLLQQALICEQSNNLRTCESIIKSIISLGLTEDELNHSIFKDVELYQRQYQSVYVTRYLYIYGILATKNVKLLEKMIEFQERLSIADLRDIKNKKSQIYKCLQFGLKVFPDYLQFWLATIDKNIDHKNYEQAQKVAQSAIKSMKFQQQQKIYVKKTQILKRKNKINQARQLFQKIREFFGNSVYCNIKAIQLQYQTKNYERAWKICAELFKKQLKTITEEIWQFALKIKIKIGSYQQCKNIAEKSTNEHPKCIRLWILYIQLQLLHKYESRARTIIDRALIKNPKNQQLYLALIQLQLKHGNTKQINMTISKALKQCPKSGQIWAAAIIREPHNTRKKKASVALEQCGVNSSINCAVAKLFWKDNKIDKARKWLEDAIANDKANGDIWVYYYKLIQQHFPEEIPKIKAEFQQIGKITHGRKWNNFVQNYDDGWNMGQQEILIALVQQIGDQINKIQ